MLTKRLLHEGSKFDIYVLEQDGVIQVSDFIGSLMQAELGKLSHLIDVLKDHGPPSNEEKFKNEGNGIYALKTTNARVYGSFHGQNHGQKMFRFGTWLLEKQKRRKERRASVLCPSRSPFQSSFLRERCHYGNH